MKPLMHVIFVVRKLGMFSYQLVAQHKYGSECIGEFRTRRGARKAAGILENFWRRKLEIEEYDARMDRNIDYTMIQTMPIMVAKTTCVQDALQWHIDDGCSRWVS